jgi:Sortase domain
VSKPPTTNPARRHQVAAAGLVVTALVMPVAFGSNARPAGSLSRAHAALPSAQTWSSTDHGWSRRMAGWSGATPRQAAMKPDNPEGSPGVADPVSVSVPAARISARLKPLHLDAKGRLVAPKYGVAGWYAAGPEPGEPGSAVIAGHLDNKDGADVFATLAQTRPGDRIRVRLEDGKALAFRVTEIGQFPQNNFPTRRVYRHTKRPELRLITCGGDYDHAAGHYLANVVVFADLAT